jgi:hypothetical protein
MPAFVAVCDLLHRRAVAGATAQLGVDGTAHGRQLTPGSSRKRGPRSNLAVAR